MTEKPNNELRRGCLIFLIVVVVLGVGAGVSVLIRGKSAKPKARALLVSKPQARLDQIKGKLAKDMPPELKASFLETFKNYTHVLEKYGVQEFEALRPLNESLRKIEEDGVITTEEANEWAVMAGKVPRL